MESTNQASKATLYHISSYHISLPHSNLLLWYSHSPYMSKSLLSSTDQFLYFLRSASECDLGISSGDNSDLPLPPLWVIRLLFNSCWITFRAWKRRELETLIQIALNEQSGHKSSQQTESSCKWKLCWTLQELLGCRQILYGWLLISVSYTYDSPIWSVL